MLVNRKYHSATGDAVIHYAIRQPQFRPVFRYCVSQQPPVTAEYNTASTRTTRAKQMTNSTLHSRKWGGLAPRQRVLTRKMPRVPVNSTG